MIDAVESLAGFENNKSEEKEERGAERTVVALVGRAIGFFAKENHKRDTIGSGGVLLDAHPTSKNASYDYENRLEIHVLVGLRIGPGGR